MGRQVVVDPQFPLQSAMTFGMSPPHGMAMLVKHLLPLPGNGINNFANQPLLVGLLDFYSLGVTDVLFRGEH